MAVEAPHTCQRCVLESDTLTSRDIHYDVDAVIVPVCPGYLAVIEYYSDVDTVP